MGTTAGPRRARIVVLALAMALPTLMTTLYFVVLARPASEGQGNPAMQLGYSVGKTLQLLLPLVAVVVWERRFPWPGRLSARGLGWGVGFALAVAAAMGLLYVGVLRGSLAFERTPAMLRGKLLEFHLATPAGFILLGTFLSVIHSLLEEYYWRWFVFGQLRSLLPLGMAIALSSLGFMSHHVVVLAIYFPDHFWTAAVPLSLGVAVGGAFWAWLYERSGSIYAVWLSHLLVDAAIMAIGYDLLFGGG